jgi:S1-C subfamily serine protease
MRRSSWIVAMCGALAGCLTGCARFVPPTEAERARSFDAIKAGTVAGEPLELYLKKRTAFLLGGGISVAQAQAAGRTAVLRFEPEPNRTVWLAQAAAVDRRGYFLTAAHCVSTQPLYIVYWDGEQARVAVPRVVARSAPPADYALIHVDHPLREVFTWAAEGDARPGATVAAMGTGTLSTLVPNTAVSVSVVMSGHLGDVVARPGAARVFHSAPLRPGDSGGPTATLAGALVGINNGVEVNTWGMKKGFSTWPGREWLERAIEQDRVAGRAQEMPGIGVLEDRRMGNLMLILW